MKKFKQLLIAVVISHFTAIPIYSFGQSSSGNNTPGFTKFLGYDGPQDLDFKTDDILRMQLMQTQTSTINGWPGIVQDGYLGLSDQTNFFSGVGPASMIHLNGGNSTGPQYSGFRPWMKYGTTITANDDLMYVGQKADSLNKSDAVIAWSDNGSSSEFGPDNLRFIFTGEWDYGGESTSHLEGGQEVMRISPAPEANMGVGNYSSNGLAEAPTERLDVDGTARLREVPNETPNVLITGKKQEIDPEDGDYVLNYLSFTGDNGEVLAGDGTWIDYDADCDWDVVNSDQDVATGFPGACVQRGTGIGTSTPESKLEVDFNGPIPEGFNDYAIEATVNTANEGSAHRVAVKGDARNDLEELLVESYGGYFTAYGARTTIGVYGESLRSPEWNGGTHNTGVAGFAREFVGTTGSNYGVSGTAQNSHLNYGVWGRAWYYSINGGPQPLYNYGVFGDACRAVRNYGVYGTMGPGCDGYAGYFNGDLAYTGSLINASDMMLKTNVESFDTGLELINQLSPKSYDFKTEEFSHMRLSEGMQYGLIAQEVQEVLPNLTKTGVMPAQFDEDGNETSPETEYLGVDYLGMVPILISAVKEQQAVIDSQNETLAEVLDQLDDLQQQINNCCSADGSKNFGSEDENGKPIFGENMLHQNNPNPFHSQTTIRYELEQGGKVMLNIFDRNGKPLATLVEAEQQAGEYRYEWDASGLPAGVYNYALYVDGELLVKKAIKLAD